MKGLALFVLTAGIVLMDGSRLVLGVHSLNQLIYGSLVGLCTCLMMVFVVQPALTVHL